MAIEAFTDGLEPDDQDAPICRFLEMWKFEDLLKSRELHFQRADKFPQDDQEGLPPSDYRHVLGLDPLDLNDHKKLNHHIGSIAQHRESFFISSWYLFDREKPYVWRTYAPEGVAVFSTYGKLKAAMGSFDGRPHLGMIRYGSKHLTGWNTMRFITTKRQEFEADREVRALLWVPDQYAGINRHFDVENHPHPKPLTEPPARVPLYLRRPIDLASLISEVVVSPFAPDECDAGVAALISESTLSIPIRRSVHVDCRGLSQELWRAIGRNGFFPTLI